MRKGIDLTSMRFGRLIALRQVVGPNPKITGAYWVCVCDCGVEKVIRGQDLRNGLTRSCGCFNLDRRRELKTTHGQSKHYLFKTWEGMVSRCHNPNDKDYRTYGARGIEVCELWRDDPAQFFKDMGPRPEGTSIDRVDGDDDYRPGNCRWATALEQGANRSNANLGTVNGHVMHLAAAARKYGIHESTILRRIQKGMTMHEAVTMKPIRVRRKL